MRKHPQVLHVEDGVLRKEDLKGPVKEGSTEDRLKEMEQEVFRYKKMVERGVEANFNIINELKSLYSEELKEMWSSLTALEQKAEKLQGQIYDHQNQNCEYDLKFSRIGLAAGCRILETSMSFETGEPLPWKRFARESMFIPNNQFQEEEEE